MDLKWACSFLLILLIALPAASEPADDRATLWFFRESADSDQSPTLFKIVPSFAERLAVLQPGTYFALDVPAGMHRFSWTAAPSRGQIVTIEAAAGQNILVRVRFRNIAIVENAKAGVLQGLQPVEAPFAFDSRVSLRIYPAPPPAQPAPAPVPARTTPPPVAAAPVVAGARSEYNAIIRIDLASSVVEAVPQDRPSGESVRPADVLTNADVISLVEANLPEELIAAKIRASASRFDTSPQALLELKRARVSEPLLMLMLEVSSQAPVETN